jgi:hypothetical protein
MGRVNQPVRGTTAAIQRATTVTARAPQNGVVIELGTMTGNMAIEAVRLRPDLTWIMVDSWLPQTEQPQRYIDTKDDNALKTPTAVQTHKATAYDRAGRLGINVLNMTSLKAACLIEKGSVDLVFIDADHSYGGVREDIIWWKGCVAPGGWIGGHDYKNIDPRFGGVDRAVDEAFPDGVETDLNYTWWRKL